MDNFDDNFIDCGEDDDDDVYDDIDDDDSIMECFEDYDGNFFSDVSSEESDLVKPEYSEIIELRFNSFTQSPCGAFAKNSCMDLRWYGFDKNAKFIYGVLFAETSVSKFFQIVKFCPVTSGFYVIKRFDGKLYRALGFDETSGTFFIAKSGTVPTIVLYHATSDFEACYCVKNGGAILSTLEDLEDLEALSCIDRKEWFLFSYYGENFFQRVIFDECDTSVSLSFINFPDSKYGVEEVFIHDKDTVIFLENWNKILVYNLENGQFNVEDFTIDGITEDIPRNYWLHKLHVKGARDFFVSLQPSGVLKLDFPAKKWRSVNFSFSVDVSLGDLSNLVNRGDFFQRFSIYDRNCTLIGEPESGSFCALFTEISTKPVIDKKRNKNGKKRKNKRKTKDKIASIICCFSATWSLSLQDLCLSKLFGEFRKNKGAEKVTDIEFCHQIGISPDLIQKYIGSSGV